MSETLDYHHDEETQRSIANLRALTGDECKPSKESVYALEMADLVLVAGQFVGAGKSTIIQALEAEGRKNIPSWTNRPLKEGEIDGIDKFHKTPGTMANEAKKGGFLELEEVRPGLFYGTAASAFSGNGRYLKDLELVGAMRLRTFADDLPIIVPLPPLHELPDKQVTEWERRVIDREGFTRSIPLHDLTDMEQRIHGVVDESNRILGLKIHKKPKTLFVINDDLPSTLSTINEFLHTGEQAYDPEMETYLFRIRHIAALALQAT